MEIDQRPGGFVSAKRLRSTMKLRLTVIIMVTFISIACAASAILIPKGLYKSITTEDYLVIDGDKISFYVKIDNRERSNVAEYPYKYKILSKSDKRVFLTLTSTEAVYGLGKYDYYWDGDKIMMKERKSGAEYTFIYDATSN